MRPLINTLTPEQLEIFVSERRERRAYRPKRSPKRLTVKALAAAWNIDVEKIRAAALTLGIVSDKVE